jgi:hypothetical protein
MTTTTAATAATLLTVLESLDVIERVVFGGGLGVVRFSGGSEEGDPSLECWRRMMVVVIVLVVVVEVLRWR